eukprot:TRINITY_DN81127_c0_g1_i1.p1 TRINITY_DN81127_c0_g1~~TRINITY_DN81127_c0_g1_i1.p1  ORF type:complete len:320 (+),score=39.90 TRINITY_DN81127_c0_g1_i1:51-1010(+)
MSMDGALLVSSALKFVCCNAAARFLEGVLASWFSSNRCNLVDEIRSIAREFLAAAVSLALSLLWLWMMDFILAPLLIPLFMVTYLPDSLSMPFMMIYILCASWSIQFSSRSQQTQLVVSLLVVALFMALPMCFSQHRSLILTVAGTCRIALATLAHYALPESLVLLISASIVAAIQRFQSRRRRRSFALVLCPEVASAKPLYHRGNGNYSSSPEKNVENCPRHLPPQVRTTISAFVPPEGHEPNESNLRQCVDYEPGHRWAVAATICWVVVPGLIFSFSRRFSLQYANREADLCFALRKAAGVLNQVRRREQLLPFGTT